MQTLPLFQGKEAYPANMCARCRGTKFLCGKPVCPLIVKYYAMQRSMEMTGKEQLDGLTPPGVFIGRFGYPKVQIGPFISVSAENAEKLDTPESWLGMSIEQIAEMRFQLVRGKHTVNVSGSDDRIFRMVQEISLAGRPFETEVIFSHKPRASVSLDDSTQPFGPSGTIERLNVNVGAFDKKLERAYNDTDLDAADAVVELYSRGSLISSIQRAFSSGTLGVMKRRKMVPTRWSITAVDDMIGRNLLMGNSHNAPIENFRIYQFSALDNRWIILMLPGSWRYELIEAWYPNTTWNPYGRQISMISSHEFFNGRRDYAEIGGCYYAARLAVNELFRKERIQAGVVILREAHPGYIMPVGVWNVREHVRAALRTQPKELDTFEDCMKQVSLFMDIPVSRWLTQSSVLRDFRQQARILDFVK